MEENQTSASIVASLCVSVPNVFRCGALIHYIMVQQGAGSHGDSPQYFALLWCHTRFTLHHMPQLNAVWWWGQSHRPLWVRGVGHLGAAWAWEDLTRGGDTTLTLITLHGKVGGLH